MATVSASRDFPVPGRVASKQRERHVAADRLPDDRGEQQPVGIGVAGRVLVGKLADGLVEKRDGIHDLFIGWVVGNRWNDQLRVRVRSTGVWSYRSLAGE